MSDYWSQFEVVKPAKADYWSQFEVVQKAQPKLPEITPEIAAQLEANKKAYANKSHLGDVITEGIKGFGKGVVVGAAKVARGATLGASDWLDRKTGGNIAAMEQDIQNAADQEGLGGKLKVVNFGNEVLGNLAGAGGAIAKGATKLGLKGAKLALGTAGLEGVGYGATESNTLEELPYNILKQELIALPTAGILSKGGAVVANKLGPMGAKALDRVGINEVSINKFIDALSNIKKTAKLKKAVASGAEDISDVATGITNRFKLAKEGLKTSGEDVDKQLTKALERPKMREAEEAYSSFINKNGGKTVADSKVGNFFEKHPVAKKVYAEMHEVNPRAFDNVKPGSLKELDMLKQTLRESRSATDTIGKPSADAYKRAERELKNIMEKEFKGFKAVNKQYAQASSEQKLFDKMVESNASKIANTLPKGYNSGLTATINNALLAGGITSPSVLAAGLATTAGRVGARAMQRRAGRKLVYDIVAPRLNSAISGNIGKTSGLTGSIMGKYLQDL